MDILVRITSEELDYIPVVRIADKEGNLLLNQELQPYGRDAFICQFGSFSLGKHSLRISPRKNFESDFYGLKPLKFFWK